MMHPSLASEMKGPKGPSRVADHAGLPAIFEGKTQAQQRRYVELIKKSVFLDGSWS